MTDIGYVNGLMEGIENCMTEESIMPMSCKCILDRMVFKGAMTEKERDKIVRNLKTQNEGKKSTGKLIDVDAFKARLSAGLVYQGADVLEALDEQPTIEERKTGKNVGTNYAECDQFVCSECGIELQDWHSVERCEDGEIIFHEYTFRYCPNCGAKMEGADE